MRTKRSLGRFFALVLLTAALAGCWREDPKGPATELVPVAEAVTELPASEAADELAFDGPAASAIGSPGAPVTALAASRAKSTKTTKPAKTTRPRRTTTPKVAKPAVPTSTGASSVAAAAGPVSAAPGPCNRTGPWRIMPLGDSLTYGNVDQGWSDTYRKDLWKFLQERKYSVDFVGNRKDDDGTFDGDHNGWGGFVIGPDNNSNASGPNNVYTFIEKYTPQEYTANFNTGKDWVTYADPDIVLLNIGTNDAEGNYSTGLRRLGDLVELIQRKAPTARVIVSSIPPSGGNLMVNPFVGKAAKVIAEKSGGRVFYSDIYTRMRAGNPTFGATPFVEADWRGNGDQTHFSASAGRKFAAAWMPEVELALKSSRCA